MDFAQQLREAALESVGDAPVETKALILNMMEAILEGEMSVHQIVEGIGSDTLPQRYIPVSPNDTLHSDE